MEEPAYCCKECGMPALTLPDEAPMKACPCKAPLVANMSAVVSENGGVAG